MANAKKYTDMMQHYFSVKERYKNCIIFYRLGDFYEMFFEDAVKASALLDLTLTGRDCGGGEKAPMCGVPYHSADIYISKLVALGEKVAICEQLSPPSQKKLVDRDVVKVVTAGTITSSELIDDKSNNFICSIYFDKEEYISLCWADITTGECYATYFEGENYISNLLDELVKISPAEIICNKKTADLLSNSPLVKHGLLPKFSPFTESEFDTNLAIEHVKQQFNLSLNSRENIKIYSSIGALISYLKLTQKHSLKNINEFKIVRSSDFMMLDQSAIKNLEIVKTIKDGKRYGSLLWLLDKTKTSMGARKLQNWLLSPLASIDKINYRLGGVKALFESTAARDGLTSQLSLVRDIERITGKISNGNLLPKDCTALKESLKALPNIIFTLSGISSDFINDICGKISDYSAIINLLEEAINPDFTGNVKDGGYIKKGYNIELDEYKILSKSSKALINQIEQRERERTGIKTLKISYNRVFGYYIELTNSVKHLAPYDYQRRQTLVGAERFVTDELAELEIKISSAEEKAIALETKIFADIKNQLSLIINELKLTSDAISDLDVILSLSKVARENSFNMPTLLDKGNALIIEEGRHPTLEKISKNSFVPNDTVLDNQDNRTMIITGPNMSGKSTYMRQTALIVLLAHIGSFVPAKSAQIPLTDKIFTRIGASDSLISDQSTFMVEMSEVAKILNEATKDSLIILDEVGRGTSTYDGLSIAKAVVEHLTTTVKAKTMFATHYHELTELESSLDGVKNYKVSVKEYNGTILFVRKIMRGGTNKSFGIEVAKLAGINKNITERAKEILKTLEKGKMLPQNTCIDEVVEENKENFSEVESIIKDLNINNISPIDALNILCDLQDKLKEN